MPLLTDLPKFRPVAVEQETLLSCITFIPVSILGLLAASLGHLLLSSTVCRVAPSMCRSANGVVVHPIALGMAPTLHGRAAWLGAAGCTRQKSGFDPKTINDVIRMGGLPFVIDLDSCPHYALHGLPRGLLAHIRSMATKFHIPVLRMSPEMMHAPAPSGNPNLANKQMAELHRTLWSHARAHRSHAAVAREVLEKALGRATPSSLQHAPLSSARKLGRPHQVPRGPRSKNITAALVASGLQVLLVNKAGSLDVQMQSLRDGFVALGARVITTESSETSGSSTEPYGLVVAQVSSGGVDAVVAKQLQHHAPTVQLRSNRKARPASRGAPVVACVLSDEAPPPLWRMWLPPFCSMGFVHDMRLL